LERRGWAVLHDLAIPGSPANIDHLVIGPGGVLVIDTKQYRGRLYLDGYGMLRHNRHLLVSALRKVLWQADQADEVLGVAEIQVPAIVAVHGAAVPLGRVDTDGVTVVPARQLPDLLQALPPCLSRRLGAAPWALRWCREHADQPPPCPGGSRGRPRGWLPTARRDGMLEEAHDSEEPIGRIAALGIGKAQLVCCVRVPTRTARASGCSRCGPTRRCPARCGGRRIGWPPLG
jgi:Nuclease-related domain